jgi:hypothetical protein
MEVRTLLLEKIKLLSEVQPRVKLDEETIETYAQQMNADDLFPPVDIFDDGENMVCADGHFRIEALKRIGRSSVAANVHEGTIHDAMLFAAAANGQHGRPLTRDDKVQVVRRLLADLEWGSKSDSAIARFIHVSQPFVSSVRTRMEEEGGESPNIRIGMDGVARDVGGIGKGKRTRRSKNPDQAQPLPAGLGTPEPPDEAVPECPIPNCPIRAKVEGFERSLSEKEGLIKGLEAENSKLREGLASMNSQAA